MRIAELKLIVAKKSHITKKISDEVIKNFIKEIRETLIKGEDVYVRGLGTFFINRVGDKNITPFGDESRRQVTKAHNVVYFRVYRPLRKAVW